MSCIRLLVELIGWFCVFVVLLGVFVKYVIYEEP
jgi:hypothetical protein